MQMEESVPREQRISPLIVEMVDGKGYAKTDIEWQEICEKYGVDIDSSEEFAAVVKVLADEAHRAYKSMGPSQKIPDEVFKPIVECAVLCDRGYPINMVQAEKVGKAPGRFQAKVIRPLQPGSTKTLVDNSPQSRLCRFMDAYIDYKLNATGAEPYVSSDINLIMSYEEVDAQTRHQDFEDYSNPEMKYKPNMSVMIAVEERGNLDIWDETHKLVKVCHKVGDELLSPGKEVTRVSKIVGDMNKFQKQEVFFGTEEAMWFLDNTIHGGGKNHMKKILVRVHAYVVRKNAVAQSASTFIPADVAWDATRNGATSKEFFLSDIKKNKKLASIYFRVDESDDEEGTETTFAQTAPQRKKKKAGQY